MSNPYPCRVYLQQPGQTYLRAAGSLGWAFPVALGAKCAAPERPVVRAVYGDRPGNPGELYRFVPVDFARLAEALGCVGVRVEQPDQLGVAIHEALAADRPAVVEVSSGLAYRAPEPWVPGGA